ncbi:MAG: membrane protein insertase YidC [Syntrophobacteraceae bacterium]
MEKRAIVALVLSLLVLVFWEYYFGMLKPGTPPPQQQSTQDKEPAQTAQSSQPQLAPLIESLNPATVSEDRLKQMNHQFPHWTLDTPLYTSQILASGARFGSMRLKLFRQEVAPDSQPMQLISALRSGYLPGAVDLLHHPDYQLSTIPFSSDDPAEVNIESGSTAKSVTFVGEVPGRLRVTKTLSFTADSYASDLEIRVKNLGIDKIMDQLGVSFYFEPYVAAEHESSYNQSILSSFEKGGLTNHAFKDLSKKDLLLKAPIDWIGYENNYFIQALIPLEDKGYQVVARVMDPNRQLIRVVYLTDQFEVDSNQEVAFKLRIYLGPKELDPLAMAEHNLVKAVDYGWFTFIAKPLLHALNFFFRYTHNYGWAIIIVTVLIKILFWPLTQKSFESMQRMKKLQPRIAELRERFKDDKEKLNTELMALYKSYKVNPLGGCLPMVLQIPVFFAFYRMLNGAVELRHQPFMLWVNDLTAPDRLWIGFDIPYLGAGLPVLTLLMGATMFLQQKMTPSAGDPRQDQIMLLMPVVFTVMFINFPSGLVLYWLINNILSIAQQYLINRRAA